MFSSLFLHIIVCRFRSLLLRPISFPFFSSPLIVFFIIVNILSSSLFRRFSKYVSSPYNRPLRPSGSVEVQLYPFMTSALRWGWVVSTTPRPLYPREGPGTHCTGGWMGPRVRLDGCGKSHPHTGIRSPDRPARSESLNRLSYPGP